MRIFSKLVFICNLCFLAAAILRLVEIQQRAQGNLNGAIPYQPLEATLVILGYGAIFINVIFFVLAAVFFRRPFVQAVSPKTRWFNLLIFPLQVYYFFFLNL